MIKSLRLIIGLALIILILGVGVYTYINREEFFSNKVTMEYPDGCVEIYMNNEMVTPECTNGREMVEQAERKPNLNVTGIPLPYGSLQ